MNIILYSFFIQFDTFSIFLFLKSRQILIVLIQFFNSKQARVHMYLYGSLIE